MNNKQKTILFFILFGPVKNRGWITYDELNIVQKFWNVIGKEIEIHAIGPALSSPLAGELEFIYHPVKTTNFQFYWLTVLYKIYQYSQKKVESEKPKVLMNISGPLTVGFCCALISKILRVKFILRVSREPGYVKQQLEKKLPKFLAHILEQFVYSQASKIVSMVKGEKYYFKNSIGQRKARSKYIFLPQFISSNYIMQYFKPFPQSFDRRLLFVTNRFNFDKGGDVLLKAMGILKNYYLEVGLDVLGDGKGYRGFKSMVENMRLSGVELYGRVMDANKLLHFYRSSYALVIPSRVEGVPRVMFEALGNGCLVIATDVGGISEYLDHNKNGLIVPSESPYFLAEAIYGILRNSRKRNYLARNGWGLIKENYRDCIVRGLFTDIFRNIQ